MGENLQTKTPFLEGFTNKTVGKPPFLLLVQARTDS